LTVEFLLTMDTILKLIKKTTSVLLLPVYKHGVQMNGR